MLKGECVITHTSHHEIHIELTCKRSRCQAVEIIMSHANFARALMHQPSPCKFEWTPENIGKKHEFKHVDIPFKRIYEPADIAKKKAAEALKPYEIDGWIGRPDDLLNYQNRVNCEVETYRVHFARYV